MDSLNGRNGSERVPYTDTLEYQTSTVRKRERAWVVARHMGRLRFEHPEFEAGIA